MEKINRLLSRYVQDEAVFFKKARALFLYNMLMTVLLFLLIASYAAVNREGFARGASGAGVILSIVTLSTLLLLKGHYNAAVNAYLFPTVIVAVLVRLITARTSPDTAFTSYIYYWQYLIVFAAVFGKKKIIIPLSLFFIVGNLIVYYIAIQYIDPSGLQSMKTGVSNSTAALLVVGCVCYINVILYDFSYVTQMKKAEESSNQLTLIQGIFSSIQNVTSSLHVSTRRFTDTAHSLSDGTQSQAAILEESSASMENIADAIKKASDDAKIQADALNTVERKITQLNSFITNVAEKADIIRKSSVEAINRGNEATDISADALSRMKKIHDSAEKIKEITHLITDIADKTNLLALNASIESARAGVAGRGFAVIADEISKLADNSTASAKEISSLINETADNIETGFDMFIRLNTLIQHINNTLADSSSASTENSDAARNQSVLSDGILADIRSVNALAQKIALLMEEQNISTKEMSTSFEGISVITQETAATSRDVAGATELLTQDIERLTDIVHRDKK